MVVRQICRYGRNGHGVLALQDFWISSQQEYTADKRVRILARRQASLSKVASNNCMYSLIVDFMITKHTGHVMSGINCGTASSYDQPLLQFLMRHSKQPQVLSTPSAERIFPSCE